MSPVCGLIVAIGYLSIVGLLFWRGTVVVAEQPRVANGRQRRRSPPHSVGTFGARRPLDSRLKRWKRAVAVAGAVSTAPVMTMVALLVVASVLPALVLAVPLFVTFRSEGRVQAPPRSRLSPPRAVASPSPA